LWVTSGQPATPAAVDALEAVLAHEPGDTLAADLDIEAEAQLGVDARRAVGATAAVMDLTDPLA
jgi:hypothetical protein